MMLFTRKSKYHLEGGRLRECSGAVRNPGRGWYRIYTYTLDEGADAMLPPVIYEGETIALVMVDIGAYRESAITAEGIAIFRRILSAFRELGTDMILRVVYDTQGKGMEREPTQFSYVIRHIGQIGAVLPEYAEQILLFQGMFVGSWGEMHSSKFLSAKYLRQMTEHFLEVTEGRIKLAFRTPALLRRIAEEGDALCREIGFFDDALLADETHMGTFGVQTRAEAGWAQAWETEEELKFLTEVSCKIPFGGEVLRGAGMLNGEETLEQLRRFRVSYLNCTHDMACLDGWRETLIEPGVSLYDYVGAHLGYRFVAQEAVLDRKGKESFLSVTIANKGFACCPWGLELVLYAGDSESMSLVLKPGELPGGERRIWKFPLAEEALAKGEAFSLGLRTTEGRIIRFANEGEENRLFLGKPVRGVNG